MNELPEAWYVIVTKQNKNILSEWRSCSNLNVGEIVGMVKWNEDNKITKGHNPIKHVNTKAYTFGNEISFETFERLVLGINKTKTYELW
jgi:hypothetical protein